MPDASNAKFAQHMPTITDSTEAPSTARPLSPALQSTLGLVAGCATGWFFGPATAVLQPVAGCLLNLLNMLSLPLVGIIYSVGQLSRERLSLIGRAAGKALLALTVAGLLGCWSVARLFPTVGNAVFAVPESVVSPAASDSLLSQLNPENPFAALATGGVPAVVLFCLLFAACLVQIENRQALLTLADVTLQVLEAMWGVIERYLPWFTFVLSATALGRLDDDLMERVKVLFASVAVLTPFLSAPTPPIIPPCTRSG